MSYRKMFSFGNFLDFRILDKRLWPYIPSGLLELDCLSCLLFSCWVMSACLWPHGLQHTQLLCPGACSNSCPLSWWCHPTISSSVVPFSSCLQFFPSIEKPFLCISSQLCGWWHYIGSLKLAIVGVFTPLHAYVFIVTQLCPALWPNGL